MRSVKKYISPIDMEIIYRAYKSVWTELAARADISGDFRAIVGLGRKAFRSFN